MPLKDEAWRLSLASYPVRGCLQTRYGDMDANAHLNNVAIARMAEEARVRFHGQLFGVPETGPALDRQAIMIAHVAIDYLAEGQYGTNVETGVAVVAVGTRSYRLAIGLFQLGRAMALADSVMVLRPGRAKVPGAIDQALKARLRALAPQHGKA
jgi:acyl-CoA thioester hydrolase